MNFNKKLFSFPVLILFLLSCLLFIECRTTGKTKKEEATNYKTGLLWEISGKDLSHKSYLFGTIHMIPSKDFFLPKGTEEAFEEVSIVFFEVDMSSMDDPAEQMALFQQSLMKDNVSLSDLLSKEDYNFVKVHFNEMGVPFFLLERIKPMFLTVLSDSDIMQGAKQDGSLKFYEFEFLEMAEKAGKQIMGLEGIEFQMGLMDSIPYEEQAEMLVESIKMAGEGNSEFDTLVSLYRDQQIGALYQSFAADDLSKHDSLLLINRNINWIPIMKENIDRSSCFFAVGAAHLAGPDGVIELLRHFGYKLKPILQE